VRRERNGKLEGNNFTGLQLTAEGSPDAVLAEGAGSAPACSRQAIAEYRHLNARVKTMTRETPVVTFGCRLCVVAQSRFSIRICFSGMVSGPLFHCGEMGSSLHRLCDCA
jgi:hypothetical protein